MTEALWLALAMGLAVLWERYRARPRKGALFVRTVKRSVETPMPRRR